jgi:hypothetical protein
MKYDMVTVGYCAGGWTGLTGEASRLFAFEPEIGGVTPAAGAGGVIGWAAGAGGAGRAGGFGRYRGPVWPQADSRARLVRSANGDFTIRITV